MSSSPVNPSSPRPDATSPITRTSTEATPVENQTNRVATDRLSGDHTPVEGPAMGNRGTTVINNVSDEEAAVSDDAKKSVATSKDISEKARAEVESASEPEDFTPSKMREKWKQQEAAGKKVQEEELNRSRSKSDPATPASPKPTAKESPKEEQPVVEEYPEEASTSPSPKEATVPSPKETPAANVENKSPVSSEKPEAVEEAEETQSTEEVAAKTGTKKCFNWYNVATIVAGVVFGVFTLLAALCAGGIFPMAFLGGQLGVGFSIVGGVLLMAAAGAVYYYRRESQKMQTAQEA